MVFGKNGFKFGEKPSGVLLPWWKEKKKQDGDFGVFLDNSVSFKDMII